MKLLRAARIFGQHARLVWRTGQLRFRLETFGLYYPALPYQRPWWQPRLRSLVLFLRQIPAYTRWVIEMETIREGGPELWWGHFHAGRRPPNARQVGEDHVSATPGTIGQHD